MMWNLLHNWPVLCKHCGQVEWTEWRQGPGARFRATTPFNLRTNVEEPAFSKGKQQLPSMWPFLSVFSVILTMRLWKDQCLLYHLHDGLQLSSRLEHLSSSQWQTQILIIGYTCNVSYLQQKTVMNISSLNTTHQLMHSFQKMNTHLNH